MLRGKFRDFMGDFWESEKHRLFNFVPVGIGVGISLYFTLDSEPNFQANLLILFTLFYFSITKKKGVFYVLLAVSLGFFIAQLRTMIVDTTMLPSKNDGPVSFVARVESCEKTENGLTFIVDNLCSRKYPHLNNLNKLHLTWRGKKAIASTEDYTPGSLVLFRVILSPIFAQAFPGAYDFRKQQYFRGVSARGFVTIPPRIFEKPRSATVRLLIQQLRHSIDRKIEGYLPRNTAAVAKALITGNKSCISQVVRQNFANAGTAHLLAISGLHMGIIGFFIFWLFRIFLCFFPFIYYFYDTKKIAAIASWLTVVFYLNLSGNSVPSIRAFIMHTLIMCAILVERRALTMRSVAIAATIIMLFSPEVILFPSFQMSFGAVIAIVAFFEHSWNFSGFGKTLFNVLATTVVASIPTALFSMQTFNQLTLNSIPANLASIPLMSFFVMPAAVVALSLMPFCWERYAIKIMGCGVEWLTKISEISAKLPGSHFVMPTPTLTNMAIFIFSGLILTLIHHRIRFVGLAGLIAGVIYYYLAPLPDFFISPNAKVIGVRMKDCTCFNHLGYFRSAALAWARSVGSEKRERFDSECCRKSITKNIDGSYEVRFGEKQVIISKNNGPSVGTDTTLPLESPRCIFLDPSNDFTKVIYLDPYRSLSNEYIRRPWNCSLEHDADSKSP
ncbi:MAG: competence protein ComEC family protein [Holosporaceae bacterium]|jgi:competence protein ComEC|nr:competence protein ComEC family protein [Holosporaceae bacterium]